MDDGIRAGLTGLLERARGSPAVSGHLQLRRERPESEGVLKGGRDLSRLQQYGTEHTAYH